MAHTIEHPSDEMLVRAVDGELPAQRQLEVERHLRECERCRAHTTALAAVATAVSEACRHQNAGERASMETSRRRLQASMTELSAAQERSWWFRMRRVTAAVPLVARVAAAAAIVAFVFQLTRPSPEGPPAAADPRSVHALPIRAFTPGATGPYSVQTLCTGRPPARQPIPASLRGAVLRQYGMEKVADGDYELDYLITPELGGIADQRNLWPERYASGIWNARVKDDLEDLLPQLVCAGSLDLATAQRDMADNWIAAYRKYFGTDRPALRQASLADNDHFQPVTFRLNSRTR